MNTNTKPYRQVRSTAAMWLGVFALVVLLFAGCSDDSPGPTDTTATDEYVYPEFFLNVEGQDVIRVSDGRPNGKIFVTPGAIRQRVTFGFIDSDGKTVEAPPDSVVVVLALEDDSRISLLPASLPDPVFQWTFSLGADRIGMTELQITFLPEEICKAASVTVQAAG